MGAFITLSCPSCGANLKVSTNTLSLKCEACGTEHIIRNEAGNILIEGYARCPICKRNDKVQKVTGLSKLYPPPKPVNQIGLERFGCIRIGSVFLCLIFSAYGFSTGMPRGDWWVAIIAIVGFMWIILDWSQKRKNNLEEIRKKQEYINEVEIPNWNNAMHKWNALYYCSRDDCVFIPGKANFAPLSQIHQFLYKADAEQ